MTTTNRINQMLDEVERLRPPVTDAVIDRAMRKPKIELRRVKHARNLSEETPAYTADVWVDGALFCTTRNDGQGGPDMFDPLQGGAGHRNVFHDSALPALNARIAATFPAMTYQADGKTHSFNRDLEVVCHELLERIEIANGLRRDLKRKIMFVKPSDGKVYSIKAPQGVDRAHICTDLRRKYGNDVRILNMMAADDAVDLLISLSA